MNPEHNMMANQVNRASRQILLGAATHLPTVTFQRQLATSFILKCPPNRREKQKVIKILCANYAQQTVAKSAVEHSVAKQASQRTHTSVVL